MARKINKQLNLVKSTSKTTSQHSFKKKTYLQTTKYGIVKEISNGNLKPKQNKYVELGKFERGGALMEACEGAESE